MIHLENLLVIRRVLGHFSLDRLGCNLEFVERPLRKSGLKDILENWILSLIVQFFQMHAFKPLQNLEIWVLMKFCL